MARSDGCDLPEQEAILAEFGDYFAACDELREFFRQHRASAKPPSTPAELIVLGTLARSYRTFKVIVGLCKAGYGQQAAMLNRTLFEDMVAAHWAVRHPDVAAGRMIEHDQYTAVLRAEQFDKHGLAHHEGKLREYTVDERKKLDARYRNGCRPWTGRGLPRMLKAVAPMWEEADRRLLLQMHDIAHRANNTLLHHSSVSLSQGVRETDDGVAFDVGPSSRLVPGVLALAFWTFGNTLSLMLDAERLDELSTLLRKHRDVYSATRIVEDDD